MNRPSRAFWVIPAQPVQELYGAQGEAPDPMAGTVLMALISAMAMNDGFGGVPAYHVSISQRELAGRTNLSHKAVRGALERLQERAHVTAVKGTFDGTRRGTNARIVYRIDLLADEATAFHSWGTSTGASQGQRQPAKGTSSIQTEVSDRGQTTTPGAVAPANGGRPRRHRKPNPSWSGRAIDTWTQCAGSPPVGPLVQALKPVYEQIGNVDWLCYGLAKWLLAGNAQFGPAVFARCWRDWVPGGRDRVPSLAQLAVEEFVATVRSERQEGSDAAS